VIRRNGAPARTITARVEAPPAQPAPETLVVTGRNPIAGATLINLSPAVALDLGGDPFAGHGVMVTKVEAGFAQTLGLAPGDFIRQINGKAINTTADVVVSVRAPAASWTLTIERGGRTITAQFSGG
jgi:S1-C subfamily serine protease